MSEQPKNFPTFFTPIIDSKALLNRNGEYFEAPLFHRRHELFVQIGRAFIKLHPSHSGTSKTGTYWQDLELSEGSYGTQHGKLVWFPVAPLQKFPKEYP